MDRIKCCTPPSVRPVYVPPIFWKQESLIETGSIERWTRVTGEQIWDLKVKHQGHWKRKCKICTSSLKVDWFTSNHTILIAGQLYTYCRIDFLCGNDSFSWSSVISNKTGARHVAAATWPCTYLLQIQYTVKVVIDIYTSYPFLSRACISSWMRDMVIPSVCLSFCRF